MNPETWRILRDQPEAASKFEYWQYWMNNEWPEKFQDFGFFMRRYDMNSFSNYLSSLSTNDETTRRFVKLLAHSDENLNDLSANVLTLINEYKCNEFVIRDAFNISHCPSPKFSSSFSDEEELFNSSSIDGEFLESSRVLSSHVLRLRGSSTTRNLGMSSDATRVFTKSQEEKGFIWITCYQIIKLEETIQWAKKIKVCCDSNLTFKIKLREPFVMARCKTCFECKFMDMKSSNFVELQETLGQKEKSQINLYQSFVHIHKDNKSYQQIFLYLETFGHYEYDKWNWYLQKCKNGTMENISDIGRALDDVNRESACKLFYYHESIKLSRDIRPKLVTSSMVIASSDYEESKGNLLIYQGKCLGLFNNVSIWQHYEYFTWVNIQTNEKFKLFIPNDFRACFLYPFINPSTLDIWMCSFDGQVCRFCYKTRRFLKIGNVKESGQKTVVFANDDLIIYQ